MVDSFCRQPGAKLPRWSWLRAVKLPAMCAPRIANSAIEQERIVCYKLQLGVEQRQFDGGGGENEAHQWACFDVPTGMPRLVAARRTATAPCAIGARALKAVTSQSKVIAARTAHEFRDLLSLPVRQHRIGLRLACQCKLRLATGTRCRRLAAAGCEVDGPLK